MLSSWFGKAAGDDDAQIEQPRLSTDLYNRGGTSISTAHDALAPRSSLDISKSSKKPQLPYSTPHDTVISQLQPAPKPQPSVLSKLDARSGLLNDDWGTGGHPHSLGSPDSASHSRIDVGISSPPSIHTGITANLRYAGSKSNVQVQPQTVDLLLDPYDGTSQGVLVPQVIDVVSPGEAVHNPKIITDTSGNSGEEMWSHLSRVLELQGQIAKMHIEMEGIGLGDGKRKPGGFKAPSSMDERRTFHGHRKRTVSSVSTVASGDYKGGDEEGVGVGDEEADQNKAREEEFAKLADQFEGKKDSIREIMNKLDDLSRALTEFHALQAPKIEMSGSRRSSMGATQTSPQSTLGFEPQAAEERSPLTHASLPPFPTLWTPPKTPFSTTSPSLLPQSFSRLERRTPHQQSGPLSNPAVPTVLVNSPELGPQAQNRVVDSPSTIGSLQLHPE